MPQDYEIVVCASGGGGNFQALVDGQRSLGYVISALLVDRECGAMARAEQAGIPVVRLHHAKDSRLFAKEMLAAIPGTTRLVVLAGFMPIVPDEVCKAWENRMINTHPSLLPEFGGIGMYGVKVHEAVLAAGRTHTGCSVHFVSPAVDGGAVILQKRVEVIPGETAWQLGGRVFQEETRLLPAAVKLLMDRDRDAS